MNMVLINGSPKGEKSCSNYLLEIFKSEFDLQIKITSRLDNLCKES